MTPPSARVGTARRLLEHAITPDTELGQHFLLDENLADLAIRQARLTPESVVLEIGAGVGTLTAPLAAAAAHVHAIEIDRRLLTALAAVLAEHRNVTVHECDAMRLDLAALDPAPTHVVSNLPYHVATPIVIETICQLPSAERWVVMLQREVADRWLAGPGSKLYGGPSVLIQLATVSDFRRSVGREVFQPRPRVDSALVGFTRIAPAPDESTRAIIRAAFATRRKTLVNALTAAGVDREHLLRILDELGLGAAVRAEAVSPPMFAALAERLEWNG